MIDRGPSSLFEDDDGDDPFLPRVLPVEPPSSAHRIPDRYRRSAGASVLAAALLGLRDIIDPPRKDRPVIEQHVGEGDRHRSMDVYLDPDDPSASLVVVRRPADDN